MPTMAQVLKNEIRRLARREIRLSLTRSRKEIATLRRGIAEVRTRIAASEVAQKAMAKSAAAVASAPGTPEAVKVASGWFTSQGIRSLRKRLHVTQAQFAQLAGVTSQAVYQWERGGARGKLGLRKQTASALAGLRDLGAREAKARLAMPKAPPVRSKKRPKARRSARKGK
jgi:DNA-binding transcriptional regulator YiaG